MSDVDEIGYQRINEGYYEPVKSEWAEIESIKGIGKKTVKDLQDIYNSVSDLRLASSNDRVPIRDDQAEKLKQHFIQLEGGRIDG